MEKYGKPFSEPCNLNLAFAKNISSFGVAGGTCIITFDSFGGWIPVQTSPSTLKPTVTYNENGTYNISIVFRVPTASKANLEFIQRFANNKVIAKYTSSSKNTPVAGTKESPLTFTFTKPDGFDGYECTLKGVQTMQETYL